MGYEPIAPFRRSMDAVLLANALRCPERTNAVPAVDKWDVLRTLRTARHRLGVTDRQLVVLQTLLSFVKGDRLQAGDPSIVVYPSNATICDRLNGMPCSTMRRHVAALASANLIRRRDSPNGKRYFRRRGSDGIPFGFDLSPLVYRIEEFRGEAKLADEEALELTDLRRQVSLMRRDIISLADYGANMDVGQPLWTEASDRTMLITRILRRKLNLAELQAIHAELEDLLARIHAAISIEPTHEMSSTPSQTEHHIQRSKEKILEEEGLSDDSNCSSPVLNEHAYQPSRPHNFAQKETIAGSPSLREVLENCTHLVSLSPVKISTWSGFVRAVEVLYPMMGISHRSWRASVEAFGRDRAAAVVAAILQRGSTIRNPGGYLRHLCTKADTPKRDPSSIIGSILSAQLAASSQL